jgi:hypothetical protein
MSGKGNGASIFVILLIWALPLFILISSLTFDFNDPSIKWSVGKAVALNVFISSIALVVTWVYLAFKCDYSLANPILLIVPVIMIIGFAIYGLFTSIGIVGIILLLFIPIVGFGLYSFKESVEDWNNRAQRDPALAPRIWGERKPEMICPHCQRKGSVRTKPIDQAKGVSGGKLAASIITAGTTLPFTGLSRHERKTQAHCDNCAATWVF